MMGHPEGKYCSQYIDLMSDHTCCRGINAYMSTPVKGGDEIKVNDRTFDPESLELVVFEYIKAIVVDCDTPTDEKISAHLYRHSLQLQQAGLVGASWTVARTFWSKTSLEVIVKILESDRTPVPSIFSGYVRGEVLTILLHHHPEWASEAVVDNAKRVKVLSKDSRLMASAFRSASLSKAKGRLS